MSWFITNKGELETNIDRELNDIRESPPPANSLRMFEHVAVHAPEDYDVIRNPRGIGYDHPYRSAIILDLATSGIKIPSADGGIGLKSILRVNGSRFGPILMPQPWTYIALYKRPQSILMLPAITNFCKSSARTESRYCV
jgi:hypothetical protein